MVYGYARVSTDYQHLDMQLEVLKDCDVIYYETISGKAKERPEFNKMLSVLNKGDIVKVYKLDRLGRSLQGLLDTFKTLNDKGVDVISYSDKLDTSSAMGRFMFHLTLLLADFERDIIAERTRNGLKALKENGVILGRPVKYDKSFIKKVKTMRKNKYTVKHISEKLNISNQMVYRLLRS